MSIFWQNFVEICTSLFCAICHFPVWLIESVPGQAICTMLAIYAITFLIDCVIWIINARIENHPNTRITTISNTIIYTYIILSLVAFAFFSYSFSVTVTDIRGLQGGLLGATFVINIAVRLLLISWSASIQDKNYKSPFLQRLFHGPAPATE